MNEQENLLQERIEWLEAGQPLAMCLAGLPEEEAEALRLAAMLQEMGAPERDEESVIAQRAGLMRLAMQQRQNGQASPANVHQLTFFASLLAWLRARPTAHWIGLGVFGPAAIMVLLVVAAALFNSTAEVAESPAIATPVDAGIAAEAPPSGPVVAEGYPAPAQEVSVAPGEGDDAVTAVAPGHTIYTPLISNPLLLNPHTAGVENVQGVVEVQDESGAWTAVAHASAVSAGQRIRTGPLSSARLTFHDGSQAAIGPNSELSIDELHAQLPQDGFRTVVLTQWQGQSEHDVDFRNDRGSRYEVKTPNGSGIARGTTFQVLVSANLLTRFVVTEGRVDVTNVNVTVVVIAGQLTTIPAGQSPSPPQFRVTGEGEVSQIGAEWVIGGQTFQTNENTLIIGNPQVGDLVYVEGHLLSNGERMADRIVLLRHALASRFILSGEVEAIGDEAWTVVGQTIGVNDETSIEEGIEPGDVVRVDGIVEADGALLAEQIVRLQPEEGYPFHFVGIVQSMGDESWAISGRVVTVDEDTAVDEEIVTGDLVAVNGRILPSDMWLAESITRLEASSGDFEFTGVVQSIDPWRVSNVAFETRPWTEIGDGIEVGDFVRVRGLILEDGAWVAASIELVEDTADPIIVIIGTVTSIDPWIVNSIQLVVDDDTQLVGEIVVGALVRVEIRLLPDGTWVVLRIQRLDEIFGAGCFTVSTVVVSVTSSQIVLQHWPAITLDGNVQVVGNLAPNSVITFQVCIHGDSIVLVVNTIIVIHQIVVAPAPPSQPPPGDPGAGLVAICKVPPGNPAARHTIYVSPPAVQAHLGTGSFLGPCP